MLNETDLSRADLNLLVLFEAVMRDRNVARAAARLNLSPSAVSHGLRRLRLMLGDPLFLRTPRGVTPTDRALQLLPQIEAILAGVRAVIGSAAPFDAATSERRFALGMPDGVIAVIGPPLFAHLARVAPRVGVSLLNVIPAARYGPGIGAWDKVLEDLDARVLDLAVLPGSDVPARFATRAAGKDALIAAMRADHPYAREPTLDHYCAARHVLVSGRGDPVSATDAALAELGRRREVVLTVPNFSVALMVAAEANLIVSLPEHFVRQFGPRLGLVGRPLPFPTEARTLFIVTSRVALEDGGTAWFSGMLHGVMAAVLGS